MKTLFILLFVILTSILISGCLQEGEKEATESIPSELLSENETVEVTHTQGAVVILEHFGEMKPSAVNINKGEAVRWLSRKPQGSFILVSEDGLFEDVELFYKRTFFHTFSETGTYKFSVKDMPQMNGTVTVI